MSCLPALSISADGCVSSPLRLFSRNSKPIGVSADCGVDTLQVQVAVVDSKCQELFSLLQKARASKVSSVSPTNPKIWGIFGCER